ncbi:lysylphosphatidylglycerol synthase domain-containing protein [Actinopolymorpha sp. NPDC004070]|uniref:lysylphosphatidylglycerol synthase transmembrane domain-containing protein n=1 Tax=Actinopolymorpha sp. NPDC004070 TaxID=3154548 RepID=UPI0033A8554D
MTTLAPVPVPARATPRAPGTDARPRRDLPAGRVAVADRTETPVRPSTLTPAPSTARVVTSGAPATAAPERRTGIKFSWRPRQILLLVAVVALVSVLAYDNRHAIDLGLWRSQLNLWWAGLAVFGMVVTLAGNAWNLMGASPVRLRFGATFGAQLAGSLVRIVSPAAVGSAAVNVQYLRRAGVGTSASVGTVSVAQSVQVLLALCLLPPVAYAANTDVDLLRGDVARFAPYAAGGLAVLVVVGAVLLRRSARLTRKVRALAKELTRSLRTMAAHPLRALVSLTGAVLISAGLITALWASVHAFGGHLGILTVAAVLLLGTSAGNAVPVPGGLGTVDAALAAALAATGVGLAVALPAVALFRLVTLWMLLPAGAVSVGVMRRRGLL